MYIFLCYRYGYAYRCICLCIYTHNVGCMHVWRKGEEDREGERGKCVYVHVCVCIQTHFLTQVYIEDKIKIILQQQAGSQRFIYIHCYHQGDEWGRSEALLQDPLWEWRRRRDATQTCTNLKAEGFGRCYLGNPGGITQGRRRGKKGEEPCLSVLGGRLKKKIWKRVSGNGWYLRCLRCCGSWKVFCWHQALSQGRRWKQKGETKKKTNNKKK